MIEPWILLGLVGLALIVVAILRDATAPTFRLVYQHDQRPEEVAAWVDAITLHAAEVSTTGQDISDPKVRHVVVPKPHVTVNVSASSMPSDDDYGDYDPKVFRDG